MTTRSGRRLRLPLLLGAAAGAALLAIGHPTTTLAAGPSGSSQVAYVTDQSSGGFNLFSDGFNVTPPANGGTYTTASPAAPLTVTIHNVAASALSSSSTALSAYDTVVLYNVCDIGSTPQNIKTLNTFVDSGGKLVIMDGAQCVDGNGGIANFSAFEKPFSDNYQLPDPNYGSPLPYTYTEPSTLTSHLPDCGTAPCNEPGNAISDASIINPTSNGWCEALGGTDSNGVSGAVEAYTRNNAGTGLIVYEGEPFAYNTATAANDKHLRLVFDNILTQSINPDGLSCSNPLSPPANAPESPMSIIFPVISLGILGALVIPALARRRRLTA